MTAPPYVELHAHSSHSLLDGVPSPQALVAHAAEAGMPALALTDHDGLYGAVPFVRAADAAGIKPILGAELTLSGGAHLTVLAETAAGYANLCRLITLGHRDQPKGIARLEPRALHAHREGLIVLSGCREGPVVRALRDGAPRRAYEIAAGYRDLFGPRHFFIELQRHYLPGETRLNRDLHALAVDLGLETAATGDVHYLTPEQREVHDVLTCIRAHTTLDAAGDRLRLNDEYGFRTPAAMRAFFGAYPEALRTPARIAARCASGVDVMPGGQAMLPRFDPPDGSRPEAYLRRLCERAMHRRYPTHPPRTLLEKELRIIEQQALTHYFLIVGDIVRFARSHGIRCQGRGSAANSLVAYLLDITPIDPVATDLVFERFLSARRLRPPDIDIDFAADRREEVIQYVYERYGRDHAAMACTLVTFRARSAVRDVARVLGFPPPLIERLAEVFKLHDPHTTKAAERLVAAFGADLAGAPFRHLIRLVPQIEGLPRHLGIHNGGMILSGPPLDTRIPVEPATMEGRTVVQWDKYALEDAGIVKVDILGLRILSAIEDAAALVETMTGRRPDLDALPPDDPEVYEMICRGETVGVFQVESRAQINLIPNFRPRTFNDLAIQIALIRPGPLQANVVRPYLRRRQGKDPVRYPHPRLEDALAETLGVIVFQEQVLKIARDLAGFSLSDGELLRRALGHKRAQDALTRLETHFLAGARANGVPETTAARVFTQLRAFGGYAFPKSHAAAFAVITYQSAWLRRYHPAAFFAGLLRHQPMGFYPARVLISEARRHGVEIRPADVAHSTLTPTVEDTAIRLGLGAIRGVGEEASTRLVEARHRGPFRSLADLCRRARLDRRAAEGLIMAGALDRWGIPRRQLLWDLEDALAQAGAPPALDLDRPDAPHFAALPERDRLWMERGATATPTHGPLTDQVRAQLRTLGVTSSGALARWPDGTRVRVGGAVVARQQPPTANGMAFLALEDTEGFVNVALPPPVVHAYRRVILAPFVLVEGQVARDGAALNVMGTRVLALTE